jgi:L-fuculose-phosphate aldolase
MKSSASEIIKYSKMLNSKKLSVLRSGNISIRFKDGFLITPSGKKYSSLKNKDIVFVSLDGKFNKKKGIPSSEWKFHQDIYKNKKEAKAIVHAHSTNATAVSTHNKESLLFIIWLQWLVGMTLNVQNMQLWNKRII